MTGNLIFKLNNRCNANCIFCTMTLAERGVKEPELDEVLCKLSENKGKYDQLIITGGEPTIYKDLFKVIKYAKEVCNYRTMLVTNGFMIAYDRFADKLAESKIDVVQVSYYAADDKAFHALSRVVNAKGLVDKAIENMTRRGIPFKTNGAITRLNYKDLPLMVEELSKTKAITISLSFLNIRGECALFRDKLAVSITELRPYIVKTLEKAKILGYYNRVVLEGFPLCAFPEYIDRVIDLTHPVVNKPHYSQEKIKLEVCKECKYNGSCLGVYKEYIKQFGDEEIKTL